MPIKVYHSERAYRLLVSRFGIPNVDPKKGFGIRELFYSRRVVFVDDEREGKRIAIWEPK